MVLSIAIDRLKTGRLFSSLALPNSTMSIFSSSPFFIGGVIRDVYPTLMVTVFIPAVEEADAPILCDQVQEPADFGIAVDRHLFREKRVRKRNIRIVLACVLLFDE